MNDKLPPWVTKVIMTALISVLITSAFGWASTTSTRDTRQDKDIAVVQESQRNIEHALERIEGKLDKLASTR